MRRVSAEPIGVMSLPVREAGVAIPGAGCDDPSGSIDHDFVIDASWRNKLIDRPN
jgi:hypothetical protein